MKEHITLDKLQKGHSARIVSVESGSDIRRRFFDIGLVPQAKVSCVGISPLGDPKAYFVCGMTVAIRSQDARSVIIDNS